MERAVTSDGNQLYEYIVRLGLLILVFLCYWAIFAFLRGSEIYLEQLIAQKDDVVLLSSDGLFDNMDDHEIEEVFQKVKMNIFNF